MKVNVYDFDKTIYHGDSTLDFYMFCLIKYPKIILCLPKQLLAATAYFIGKINKTEFKEHFFVFLQEIDNTEILIADFWNKNEYKIKQWYLQQKSNTDVIISASPQFLLLPICKRLNVGKLIASEVDIKTGKYSGNNCYGEEKLFRIKKEIPDIEIDNFYSDSKSDLPLAKLSSKAYFVSNNVISLWKKNNGSYVK